MIIWPFSFKIVRGIENKIDTLQLKPLFSLFLNKCLPGMNFRKITTNKGKRIGSH